jgi:Cu(I)/Ag(I) efflux system membrane protein CusA/SilA
MDIDRTIEGRERYTINVRYPRELRDDLERLRRVLVPTMDGAQIPLAQLGRLAATMGPPMIKSEAGSLVGWVYVDVVGRDIGGYVRDAKAAVADSLELPAGYRLGWTGQYGSRIAPPAARLPSRSRSCWHPRAELRRRRRALLVATAVPLSLVGSIWLMALGYLLSIAASRDDR